MKEIFPAAAPSAARRTFVTSGWRYSVNARPVSMMAWKPAARRVVDRYEKGRFAFALMSGMMIPIGSHAAAGRRTRTGRRGPGGAKSDDHGGATAGCHTQRG
jgi:hypothetical protein